MSELGRQEVKRRRMFYISGYDPIPPRRYRELYRSESAKQAAISDYTISIAPKSGERFGWSVDSAIEGGEVHTEIDVLVWSDIVQDSMDAGILRTYGVLARTAWIYISTGALFRLMRLRKGPVIAALYPVGALLVQLLIAIAVVYGVSMALMGLSERLLEALNGPRLFQPWMVARMWGSVALGLVAGVALLRWFKKMDGKFFAYYLMHDYGFSARWRGADPPQLTERMAEFRAAIAQALTEDWDEVLVVGHSSGAHLGISVLADLIRAGEVPEDGPALSFLSLGQVVPMVSFLPEAKVLRRDLAYLSATDALFWLDVTAPGDGCAFALCDPAGVTGVAPEAQTGPLVISAAFTQSLKPETWKALRWRFFRLHFQYLCAFDAPQSYDYFKITAGPQTLATRYKTHAASPSRITDAANRFTEIAS
ncbi:hypothetical protein [Celeribacter sp.]|uniref:hypothetical protein n=1 Tax=Celeribacter sp. TaxID=1890673 RepID=UPI003A8D10FC